jgi:DNA polymerase I-like protein with 3'-5' exonuclease and polymerase domains
MASDEGGTRTGRLSCKNPNAQQFPKRSKLFDAKSVRKCLLPEDGELWSKKDYWSQEPVIQLHYGIISGCAGTAGVMEAFERGEKLYSFIEKATAGRCDYDQSKGVLLGRSYKMGKVKMAETVGMTVEESLKVLEAFDSVAPYISECADKVEAKANTHGLIRGLEDRPMHFNYWEENKRFTPGEEQEAPLSREEAIKKWGAHKIRRASIRKAFNKLIQGSAASQTKRAMVEQYKATGLVPLNQVHDDIGHSVQNEQQHNILVEIQRDCVKLRAPVRVDAELLKTWA